MTIRDANNDTTEKRLADLEAKVEELSRKTFVNLAVTDVATNVKSLEIGPDATNSNRSHIQIRDSAGNVILANDTVAGWGYSAPNTMYPMYPNNSSAATQQTTAGQATTYIGRIRVNCPKLTVGALAESSGGGGSAGGDYKIMYSLPATPNTLIQIGATASLTGVGYQYFYYERTVIFPSNLFGQLIWLQLQCGMTSGVGAGNWVANTPSYVFGSGA